MNNSGKKHVYAPVTLFDHGKPIKGPKGWVALTDKALKSHLSNQDKEFIGLYPMFEDNTCKFVVIDIDKENWQKICTIIRKICFEHSIPFLVEISQSGNGCHIWIFFKTRIKARKARNLADKI